MKIYEAVVVRINEIPSVNGAFTQKEIIVSPYTPDREISSEFIAIPPGIFPTDSYGSGAISLPELNQRCIVCETAGYRRVQILSYIPFATTSAYGEYTPVDVSSGGAVFKVGGATPISMYFHKGGIWELFSNEFCKFYLDGTERSLKWTVLAEERMFAGGRVLNTYGEVEGSEHSTRHIEIYTREREWKQNTDIKIAGEKSVLNPETTIIPMPDYSYVPKVIIKAGMVLNDFDSSLGQVQGHVYEIETRQATYSGNKDTVSILKLGRQSEMYRYDNDRVYPAGSILEWSGKTSQITSATSRVSTHLFRYGQLNKDVIANGAPVEYIQGEVYRNQSNVNIIEPLGAPLIDIIAEGKGYDFEWNKLGATEQYLQSFGRLTSQELEGNEDFLYKSGVREHFHVYDDHNIGKMTAPTGMTYDFVNFFQDNGVNGLYFEKFSRIEEGIVKIFQKELLTNEKHEFELDMSTQGTRRVLDAQKYENTVHIDPELELNTLIETNLYKNYVKLDGTHEKTEELTNSSHNWTIKLGTQTYNVKFEENSVIISLDTGSPADSPSIQMTNAGIVIDPGSGVGEATVYLGGSGFAHKLVTKEWLEMVFANHMHPTAGTGPPSPPIPIPAVSVPVQTSHLTYIGKVE